MNQQKDIRKSSGETSQSEFNPNRFVESFISIVKDVITRPKEFFAQMPRDKGFPNPTIFIMICVGISSILSLLLSGSFSMLVFTFIWGMIMIFLGSLVIFIVSQKIFGGESSYEATFRVAAYSGVVNLVGWIPVISLLAFLYWLYLIFLGIKEINEFDDNQSILSVLISAVIMVVIGAIISMGFGLSLFMGRIG